jgi:ABC-type branched-subunit amino acid transport system substrate-binding protein
VTGTDREIGEGIRVGALLPFTGRGTANGGNIERGITLAVEHVNRAGGVAGHRVVLVSRDTRSDAGAAAGAARTLLDELGAVALIGPHHDSEATKVIPLLRSHRVVGLSGGVASPKFATAEDGDYWFRTVPSSLAIGRGMAERMRADGIGRATAMYSDDEYGFGLASVFHIEYSALGGQMPVPIEAFRSEEGSYIEHLQRVFGSEVEAVFLIGRGTAAAELVQDWAVGGFGKRWYLAPSLRDQAFVDNTPAAVLDGTVGISPALSASIHAFDPLFAARWNGDRPLQDTYFYYDAVLLWALAAETVAVRTGGIDGDLVRDALLAVSAPPGERVAWDQLERAMELVRGGVDIDYDGITGDVDLNERGELQASRMQFWRIEGHHFADLDP